MKLKASYKPILHGVLIQLDAVFMFYYGLAITAPYYYEVPLLLTPACLSRDMHLAI